jgi:multidrug/hemolysin transport system permease protein
MSALKYLISRNIKLYLRNKSTVFFSFLSMIIIIGLYALFMADANVDSLTQQYGGSREIAEWLINSWIMGGIITVNAVNITLVLLVTMVEDESNHRIKDFLVAPLKKYQIIGGYLGSAIIVGTIMSILSVVVAELYIILNGGELLSLINMIRVLIGIIFTVISVSSMSLFFLLFIKSEKTASTITTVVGTLIGFIAGVYVPIGVMPDFIQKIMKLLPITYSATMFKQIFVEVPSKLMFVKQEDLLEFNKMLGNVIYIGNNEITYVQYLIILSITTIVFFILALIKIKKDNR